MSTEVQISKSGNDNQKDKREKKNEKDGEDSIFALHDYTAVLINVKYDSRKWSEDAAEIIGDSGASAIIFNLCNAHLATDLKETTGAIQGSNGTQLGAILYEGFTEFMGVRVPCYVADISKSVVGIGFITQEYNFDVLFSGKFMHIYSQLSGETSSVIANNQYLFPLPETLFQSPKINVMMTCLSADSLVSL